MSEPTPSTPEINGPQPGIQFEIQKPELIYAAVKNGASGKLAHALLESPLKEIELDLAGEAGSFDLIWEISFARDPADLDMGNQAHNAMNRIVQSLKSEGNEVLERGGSFIVPGERGTQLVISHEFPLDRLFVSTGKMRDMISRYVQVVPSPDSQEDTFNSALADTTDLIRKIADGSYEAKGKVTPDQKVIIGPPKRSFGESENNNPDSLIGKIEIEKPSVTFEDIGGQDEAKREIEGLAYALSHPDMYKKWGTKPPKGILLYGPPGTGKTLMAKALASQADARFFHVKASDIGSKWYGESEQLVQQIFDAASSNGKTIIYFDEIDSISPNREGQHEATQRVIGTLLQNIDGMDANDNVLIVASTNRMQHVDPAMLRPGRLDRLVEVGLPEKEGREQIFKVHMGKASQIADRELFSDVDLERIAAQTDELSGADIAEIIRRTLEEKVRLEGRGTEPSLVSTQDILKELESYERVVKSRKKDQASSSAYL